MIHRFFLFLSSGTVISCLLTLMSCVWRVYDSCVRAHWFRHLWTFLDWSTARVTCSCMFCARPLLLAIRATGPSASMISLAISLRSFRISTSHRCCTSLAPLRRMCSCSFRSLISQISVTFAVLAWLLARLELKNVFLGPRTIRICFLHHCFSSFVSSLLSSMLVAAFFAASIALAMLILTVIPFVSGSPLRLSSWSSSLHAMTRLYGVLSSGTAAVSSSSAFSLPFSYKFLQSPPIASDLVPPSLQATSIAWAMHSGPQFVSLLLVGQSSVPCGTPR